MAETNLPQHPESEQASPAKIKCGLVEYPFQLRPGVMIYLRLPADFNHRDLLRLTAHLSRLALGFGDE